MIDVASIPSATGNHVEVAGRVRDTSSKPLRFVKVTASFEDAAGKQVRSEFSFCEPQTIEPGDLASFSLSAQSDARYVGFKPSFRGADAAIPWIDRSGKSIHD